MKKGFIIWVECLRGWILPEMGRGNWLMGGDADCTRCVIGHRSVSEETVVEQQFLS